MTRILWIVALLTMLTACQAPASKELAVEETPQYGASQYTTQELLARHIDALGGADKLSAVATVLKRGTINTPDFTGAPVVTAIRNRAAYVRRIEGPGNETILAWDGQTAWQKGAIVGSSEVIVLDAKQALLYSVVADIAGPLVDAASKGYQLELLGTDEEGLEVLQMVIPELGKRLYFLDPKTFLVSRVVEYRDPPDSGEPGMKVITRYSRFRSVDGAQFAFFENTKVPDLGFEQSITWDTIEVNVELDDSMFAVP